MTITNYMSIDAKAENVYPVIITEMRDKMRATDLQRIMNPHERTKPPVVAPVTRAARRIMIS